MKMNMRGYVRFLCNGGGNNKIDDHLDNNTNSTVM